MRALLAALALGLVACQTAPVPPIQLPPEEPAPAPAPLPDPPDLAGLDRDEALEAAREYIAAARAAGVPVGGGGAGVAAASLIWDNQEKLELVRWMRVADQSLDTFISFQARPQHLGWWTGMPSRPVTPPPHEAPEVHHAQIFSPWDGCTEFQGILRDPPTPDPDNPDDWIAGLSSVPSNVVVHGDCIDPPPDRIPVPEPGLTIQLAAGIPLLALLNLRRANASWPTTHGR